MAPLHILYKVTTELHKQTSTSQFTEKEKRIGWLRLVRPGLIDTDDPEKLKPDAHLALQAKLLGDYFFSQLKIAKSPKAFSIWSQLQKKNGKNHCFSTFLAVPPAQAVLFFVF